MVHTNSVCVEYVRRSQTDAAMEASRWCRRYGMPKMYVLVSLIVRCIWSSSPRIFASLTNMSVGLGSNSKSSSAVAGMRDMWPKSSDITVPHQAGSCNWNGNFRLMRSLGDVVSPSVCDGMKPTSKSSGKASTVSFAMRESSSAWNCGREMARH